MLRGKPEEPTVDLSCAQMWHGGTLFPQLRMRVNALPSGSQHLNDYNSEQPTWEERLGIS